MHHCGRQLSPYWRGFGIFFPSANEENEKALASLDRALASFARHEAAAQERGVEMTEPGWVEDVRVMRQRLSGPAAG